MSTPSTQFDKEGLPASLIKKDALKVRIDAGLPLTAFADLRTAELTPQFQLSYEYTVSNTDITSITTTGSGTVIQENAMAVVSTGTDIGSTATLRSKRHAKYRSGFGGLLRFTDLFTSPVAGTSQIFGMLDELGSSATFKNGLAIGYDKAIDNGLTFCFLRYANDVLYETRIQDWNDPLDGSGDSEDVIDHTTLNVNAIRFQFLGAGAFQLLREEDQTGILEPVLEVNYSNKHIVPSSFNPNYHSTQYVDNGATTANLTLKCSSTAYFIEGKTKYSELQQPHFSTEERTATNVTGEVPIVTIRNKSTYASKTNFIDIIAQRMLGSIEASSANNLGNLRLISNVTLTGESFFDKNITNSVVEIDVSATSFTGGEEIIPVPLAGKNDKFAESLVDLEIIIAPGETLTIAGSSSNSATMNAALLWKELF